MQPLKLRWRWQLWVSPSGYALSVARLFFMLQLAPARRTGGSSLLFHLDDIIRNDDLHTLLSVDGEEAVLCGEKRSVDGCDAPVVKIARLHALPDEVCEDARILPFPDGSYLFHVFPCR